MEGLRVLFCMSRRKPAKGNRMEIFLNDVMPAWIIWAGMSKGLFSLCDEKRGVLLIYLLNNKSSLGPKADAGCLLLPQTIFYSTAYGCTLKSPCFDFPLAPWKASFAQFSEELLGKQRNSGAIYRCFGGVQGYRVFLHPWKINGWKPKMAVWFRGIFLFNWGDS